MNKKGNVGVDAHIDPKKRNKNVGAGLVSAGNGITLVALVITIIVLLILAGITINLTVGQKGIITRAQEAGKNYQEAAKKEDEDLGKFLGEADNIIAGINTPTTPSGDNYTMVDGVPVPKGFEHTEGTKETGFVIRDNSGTDTNGNEFVWIPCTEDGANESIKYDRYAFSRTGWSYTQTKNEGTGEIKRADNSYVFTETMPMIEGTKTELDSIKRYGGFYIGRYETGIVDYDANVKTSNTNKETEWTGYSNGKAVVQKDKQVWNYITRDMAKKVAEEMYHNNDVVISRLCSSYAWDTALKFIETNHIGYATNSGGDNYSGTLKHTGIGSTPKNNIYNMGGNVREWTTEVCSHPDYPCTLRGGRYNHTASDIPAGFRSYGSQTSADGYFGFRSTLFVGL